MTFVINLYEDFKKVSNPSKYSFPRPDVRQVIQTINQSKGISKNQVTY